MTTRTLHRPAVPPTPDSPPTPPAVAWSRVGWFVLIALGGGWVVGLILRQVASGPPAEWHPLLSLSLAVVYMPLPLVAGLVVERIAGRRPILLRRAARGLRSPRRILAVFAAGGLPAVGVAAVSLTAALLLAGADVPGAGHVVATVDDLAGQLGAISGQEIPPDAVAGLPPVPVIVAVGLLQAIILGASVNALFALGEEYGWRGVLAEELAPLGRLRANLVIGTVWGLWHAPIIIWLGHNFGEQWGAGVPLMVAMCIPFGFVLAWTAARAGVFGAAVGHGVFNSTMGVMTLLIADASPLIAPAGAVAVLGCTVVAVVLWTALRPTSDVSPR